MLWFKRAFGFKECGTYEETRSRFRVATDDEGSVALSVVGGGVGERRRSFHVGKFDTPSVAELNQLLDAEKGSGRGSREGEGEAEIEGGGGLTFRHVVGDVARQHRNPANRGRGVFQAASQFNCLEMPAPTVTPDDGITNYAADRTQGPACAMACPAGTVYRNYFVGGGGEKEEEEEEQQQRHAGQGGEFGRQLNTLEDVEMVLGKRYWKMKNGYALPASGRSIAAMKADVDGGSIDMNGARSHLRVGVHWDTEVAPEPGAGGGGGGGEGSAEGWEPFRVAQVYCSAVPIAYDYTASKADWEPLARLCLDGSYEATLAVAAVLARRGNRRMRAFLTKVGGGAFGNSDAWISDAIKRSLEMFKSEPIDVFLLHYGDVERHYLEEIDRIGDDIFP